LVVCSFAQFAFRDSHNVDIGEVMKHLLGINKLSKKDILDIIKLAKLIKQYPKRYAKKLEGKALGLVFEKPSTRTRVSFQVAMTQMGGEAQYLGPNDIKLGSREALRDEARVLSRYWDAVALRTFSHKTIEGFSDYSSSPVINALSDVSHPCQVLADYLTIQEHVASKEPIVAYLGDGNNVLTSLLFLFAKIGGHFHYCCPDKFKPSKSIMKEILAVAKTSGALIQEKSSPASCIKYADVVYTDVWVSMGEEKIKKTKMKAFNGFQVNDKLLTKAQKKVYVMHCLPAHRGEEITDSVIESKRSIVFDQAENRLHAQKAILLWLLKDSF